MSYPLEFYGRKVCASISKPTQEEYDALSEIKITASYQFNPVNYSIPKLRRLNNKKIRIIQRRLNKISESTGISIQE